MRGINFEDEITFVLILRKVRSFVGSSSLNMVLAWSTRLLRSPLYWTVVALSRVDLIGTFFKFCYLFVCVQKICLTPSLFFLSFVICLSVFKRFVSPPRCFFKFCYLFVFIQKIHPLVVFFLFFVICFLFKRFVSLLVVICLFLFKRFVSPPRCFLKFCYLLFLLFIQQICLTPSLLTTIVPITPLWLTSRFRVSSTSDAIFLKYQILFFFFKRNHTSL